MSFQNLDQGIKSIQVGNYEEGARLLRIALKDDQLTGKLRAVALVWLAETNPDPAFKIQCYHEALAIDPQNEDVSQRLAVLLSPPQQPTPPAQPHAVPPQPDPRHATPNYRAYQPPRLPTDTQPMQAISNPFEPPPQPLDSQPLVPQQAYNAPGFYRTVGIHGGPNGPGSGFFVARDGLIATTRYVTGGIENLTIELVPGQHIPGRTVRAFPHNDLAFVRVGLAVSQLMTVTNMPYVPDNIPLTVVPHNGNSRRTMRRATNHHNAPQWFPTDLTSLPDAGGAPIFDDRSYLVGMITQNASRTTGHLYALTISAIYQYVQHYIQETRAAPNRMYCPCCGYVSRAADYNAFYCENCGATLPYAEKVLRRPQSHTDPLYGENMHAPCPRCRARVGYHHNKCLRCGERLADRRR